ILSVPLSGDAMRPIGWLVLTGTFMSLATGCENAQWTVGIANAGDPTVEVSSFSPLRPEPILVETPAEVVQQFHARLEAARTISNPFERDEVHAKLAVSAARAGLGDGVRQAIGQIANPFMRDESTSRCAILLTKAGQGPAAVELAKQISNPFERDAALKKMALGG